MKPLTWTPHLLLLAALTTELGRWRRGHRSDAELATIAQTAATDERLDALHQLANRSLASAKALPSEKAMLRERDARVQDFLFTTAFVRHLPVDPKKESEAYKARRARLVPIHELLKSGEDDARALRWAFFFCNNLDVDVEKGLWMPIEEIDCFFDACRGVAPSHERVLDLLTRRYPGAKFDRDRVEKNR